MKNLIVKQMFGKNLSGKNLAYLAYELSIAKIPVLKNAFVNAFLYEFQESIPDSEYQAYKEKRLMKQSQQLDNGQEVDSIQQFINRLRQNKTEAVVSEREKQKQIMRQQL